MRYEIDKDTLAVKVFDDLNPEPFLLQPHFPDGTAFEDFAQAKKFAEAVLAHHKDSVKNAFPTTANDLA